MSVVSWRKDTETMEVTTHLNSGRPDDVEASEGFLTPVDKMRSNFLFTHLGRLFPDKKILILGSYWDYSLSNQEELHRGTPIGHYRVSIGGQNRIVCINRFDTSEALGLGAEVFEAFKAEDVEVVGPVQLPNDQWVVEAEGYYLHLETFVPNAKTLVLDGNNKDWLPQELGAMAGRMYKAAREIPADLQSRLEHFANDTVIRCWKVGMPSAANAQASEIVDKIEAIAAERHADKFQPGDIQGLFQAAADRIQTELPHLTTDRNRIAGCFNLIEKMVKHVDGEGVLRLYAYDSVSRGCVGMMTKNATYDAATAIYRIIMNARNCSMDDIRECLESYIAAYNAESGLNLDLKEASEAALNAFSAAVIYGLGYAQFVPEDDNITLVDQADHCVQQEIPRHKRIQEVARHLGVS